MGIVDQQDLATTSDSVAFAWSETTSFSFSHIQIARDAQFTDVVFERSRYTGLTQVVTTLEKGEIYYWRVRGENSAGMGEWSDVRTFGVHVPVSNEDDVLSRSPYLLDAGYPNPVDHSTTIRFSAGAGGPASLRVFDLQGRNVAVLFDDTVEAGSIHEVELDAAALVSGVYVIQLESAGHVTTRSVVVVK